MTLDAVKHFDSPSTVRVVTVGDMARRHDGDPFRETQIAVGLYVGNWIREQNGRGVSYRAIGERVGRTHAWALGLAKPKYQQVLDAGTEYRVAEVLHNGSVEGLRAAALAYVRARRPAPSARPVSSVPPPESGDLPKKPTRKSPVQTGRLRRPKAV